MSVSAVRTLLASAMLVVALHGAQAQQTPNAAGFALEGLVSVKSTHSFAETLVRLEASLTSRMQTIFARFDHAANARNVGLDLAPATVIVFGNPKGGTPLMQARPSLAIDLPMKFLVQQDAAGAVTISYNDPEWLGRRHALPAAMAGALQAISRFLAENANMAAN